MLSLLCDGEAKVGFSNSHLPKIFILALYPSYGIVTLNPFVVTPSWNRKVPQWALFNYLHAKNIIHSLFQSNPCYLESNICLRTKLGWRYLQVGFSVHKVDADQLFTFIALVTRQALADRLICFGDALSSILTLVIITWTGARQDHWWRKLTEKTTGCKQKTQLCHKSHSSDVAAGLWHFWWCPQISSHLYPSGHLHV